MGLSYEYIPLLHVVFHVAYSHGLFMHQKVLFKQVDSLCASKTFDVQAAFGDVAQW